MTDSTPKPTLTDNLSCACGLLALLIGAVFSLVGMVTVVRWVFR